MDWAARLAPETTDFPVGPAQVGAAVGPLTAAGYSSGPEQIVACWLDADRLPSRPTLPAGCNLVSRAMLPDRPHPMAARNGAAIAARLSECSLYGPDLDLAILGPDGGTAAYGLFWPDLVTGVGLVEPLRTEEPYRGLGLASYLLAEGCERLAAAGCRRIKVSNDLGLYLRAGFVPELAPTATVWQRPSG